ncbi:hypothetical protein B0A64_14475 [Flavobacterium araucananum]|uniref:Uncharacterized protein n=1 Tax=Flavobacterium araucananum TaxID=946678 RepID=A0A227P4M2_9FLAO|nr:hypothetical protein B0A64_14475 [Flavobacterium araucananum]
MAIILKKRCSLKNLKSTAVTAIFLLLYHFMIYFTRKCRSKKKVRIVNSDIFGSNVKIPFFERKELFLRFYLNLQNIKNQETR